MIKTDTWMLGGGRPPVRFISEGQFISQEELFAQIKGGTDITPSLAYAKVVWAYRATNLRAMTIGGLPWRILNKKQEEVEWPLAEKLAEVIPLVEYALCIWGASYILKQANRVKLGGLQWLNPATMKPVSSPASGITGFEQRLPGKEQAPNKFAPEQVIYHRLFNPDDDLGPGVSPMAAALSPAGLARNANTFAEKFFENGAIPSVIFTTEQNIPDPEIERIREWWGRLQSGVRNAWKTAIMRNGLKPETIGSPIKDLVLASLMQEARSQIAVAFGIPQTLLEDAASYATAKEHKLSFYYETIFPEARLIANGFNRQLFTPYGLTFEFCFGDVEAVQQDEATKSQATVLQWKEGLLEKWEAREILGHSPVAQPSPEVAKMLADENAKEEAEPEEESEEKEEAPAAEVKSLPVVAALSSDAVQELAKWRRKAVRFWIENKPQRMGEWNVEAIPDERAAVIRERLAEAETVEGVKAAFDNDEPMESYRRVPRARRDETPTKAEIDKAIAEWDKTMPEFAGMLEATLVKAGK